MEWKDAVQVSNIVYEIEMVRELISSYQKTYEDYVEDKNFSSGLEEIHGRAIGELENYIESLLNKLKSY